MLYRGAFCFPRSPAFFGAFFRLSKFVCRRSLHVIAQSPHQQLGSFAQKDANVTAIYVSAGYDLGELRSRLLKYHLHVIYKDNFIIVEGNSFFEQSGCTAIVFKNGCAVMWNMSTSNEKKFLEAGKASQKKFAPDAADSMFMGESEQFNVIDTEGSSSASPDGIQLTTSHLRLTDKVAASFALMTAVRLNVVEKKIERQLHIERHNIEEMKGRMRFGNLNSLAEHLFCSMTTLHQLRYELNIEHDLQDLPDVLWDFESQSLLFKKLQKIFDLPQRIDLLNARVALTFDFLNTLADYVDKRHSSRLEKIIIVLIFLELVLGLTQALR
eukprot:GHVS01063117.1.p1 GENE.GHVS01063117.1~~GHVS01063117.1.p1  ORF type:complete len:326 (+),score=31.99 GHVS01063117.1:128-1105(+)